MPLGVRLYVVPPNLVAVLYEAPHKVPADEPACSGYYDPLDIAPMLPTSHPAQSTSPGKRISSFASK